MHDFIESAKSLGKIFILSTKEGSISNSVKKVFIPSGILLTTNSAETFSELKRNLLSLCSIKI